MKQTLIQMYMTRQNIAIYPYADKHATNKTRGDGSHDLVLRHTLQLRWCKLLKVDLSMSLIYIYLIFLFIFVSTNIIELLSHCFHIAEPIQINT